MNPPGGDLRTRWPLWAGCGLLGISALLLTWAGGAPERRASDSDAGTSSSDPPAEPQVHVVRLSREQHGIDLGEMVPGGSITAVLVLDNDTKEHVPALSFQGAECSCDLPRGYTAALEPGKSVRFEFVQHFQSYDFEQSRFRLVDREGRIRAEVVVGADVEREPFLLSPVRYLGRMGPNDVVEAEILIAAPLEAGASRPASRFGLEPEVEVSGELQGFLTLEGHPQEPSIWRYRGNARPRAGLLGALRGEVALRLGRTDTRALLLLDVWPAAADASDALPRVVLGGSEPEALALELPVLEIHSARWESESADASWPITFRRDGATGLHLRINRDGASSASGAAHRRLALDTDRGRVLLCVIAGDVPIPEEFLPPASGRE